MSVHPRTDQETKTSHGMHNQIRIADFNFDVDGDGKVDAFENRVMRAFKAADVDNSGTLTPAEMISVMKEMSQTQKANKGLKSMLAVAVAIIVMLIGAMLAVSIAAGEMVKESHVGGPDGTEMISTNGDVVQTDNVESFTDIFETPLLEADLLAKLSSLAFFIDMRATSLGDYASAVYSICGVYKKDLNEAFLKTCTGELIKVKRAGQTASILMDNVEYPILETLPASARRRMDDLSASADKAVFHGRELRGRGSRSFASFGVTQNWISSNRAGND